MKLTTKDRNFLETLKRLLDEKQLRMEFREDGVKRLVLKQNYGDKIHEAFGVTRQGVRWRFNRLFNSVYVEAYERVFWVESNFGTDLRHYAIAIAKQKIELAQKVPKIGQPSVVRRETGPQGPESGADQK